ncbi:MAG: transposase family protein [Thermomicrobiales bacterium]
MQSTPPLSPLSVSPTSLAAAFREVPDPRRAASVVYPLPAMLALAVAALLANQHSVLAIAEWGARQDAPLLAALGFPPPGRPANRRGSGSAANVMGRHWPPR